MFLKKYNIQEFYKDFITLGAKEIKDLEFIEYQDLINMKMNTEKRKIIYEEIKKMSIQDNPWGPKKINVYFSPYLSEEELLIQS